MAFDPPARFQPPKKDTYSEQWRHECEVRYLENLDVVARMRLLEGIRDKRSHAAYERILKDMSDWCLQEIADERRARMREADLLSIIE